MLQRPVKDTSVHTYTLFCCDFNFYNCAELCQENLSCPVDPLLALHLGIVMVWYNCVPALKKEWKHPKDVSRREGHVPVLVIGRSLSALHCFEQQGKPG